jgi:hypothetical protein
MILATTRAAVGLGLPGPVASTEAATAAGVGPTEARLGGGELLRRARRKTLPLAAPSLAAGGGLDTMSDGADAATGAGGEPLRRARRSALPLALPSPAPSDSSGLDALATGLELMLEAAALRRARRDAARDVRSASPGGSSASPGGVAAGAAGAGEDGATLAAGELPLVRGPTTPDAGVLPVRFARPLPSRPTGIGMPLARAGPLDGGGVLLRADWRVAGAALSGTSLGWAALGSFAGRSALEVPRRGAPRRDGAVWRSSIGRPPPPPLPRGGKPAASSESHSDGSGLPSSRLPERRCVPVAKAPSSGSGHSSILFMPGVLSTGGGSSHSEGGTRSSATLTLAADAAQDKRTGGAPVSSRRTAEQAPSAGRPGGARFWGLSLSSGSPSSLELARSERGRWM